MAKEIVLTQDHIDSIHQTEKMSKATLIIVSVAAGLVLLFIVASSIHMVMEPRQSGSPMMQQRPGLRGGTYRQGIQPQTGRPNVQNDSTQQGQTQGTSTMDLDAL